MLDSRIVRQGADKGPEITGIIGRLLDIWKAGITWQTNGNKNKTCHEAGDVNVELGRNTFMLYIGILLGSR